MSVDVVCIRILPDGRLRRAEAARFLGLAPATMAAWAVRGVGPLPRRVGGRVFYYLKDLEAFRDEGVREAAQRVK
jgi:hypothetical protein